MAFIMPEGRQLYRGEISLNAATHQADAVASCDQGGGCEKTYFSVYL
jgi:hypothetical protein